MAPSGPVTTVPALELKSKWLINSNGGELSPPSGIRKKRIGMPAIKNSPLIPALKSQRAREMDCGTIKDIGGQYTPFSGPTVHL